MNLGLPLSAGEGAAGAGFSLFPICTACGATRSPRATEGELVRFGEEHQKFHGQASVEHVALHVELTSDTLEIGPFKEHAGAVNLFEAVRIGARLVLDMGTTELEGFVVLDEHGGHWMVMYDPMPGGSGFLPQIIRFWEVICDRARQLLEHCPTGCERACYSCLKHFRNQMDHEALNRHDAVNLLQELSLPVELSHKIPPVSLQPAIDKVGPDSIAELTFADICQHRGFPVPPKGQFRVSFDDGSYTDADWAYPDKKVLVFIDGMGPKLHGDPKRAQRDKLLRAKARMKGYQVVEITAEALQDEGSLGVHLEELAMYLGASEDH